MFDHLLEQIANSLDAAGIPYMIVGGKAVLLYGEPRFTRDIDVTLGIGTDRLEELLRLVDARGWASSSGAWARASWRRLINSGPRPTARRPPPAAKSPALAPRTFRTGATTVTDWRAPRDSALPFPEL